MRASRRKTGVIVAPVLCVALAAVALLPSGMFAATVAPRPGAAISAANAPVVNTNSSVTFTLTAPDAVSVILNLQNRTGKAPSSDPFPMTKDASGVWSYTTAPLDPSWWGYDFTVDGAQVADPTNRDISFFQVPPIWTGPESAWSMVMVPGPAADYMADNPAIAHGAVSTVHYYSSVLKTEKEMVVYTPPGYNNDSRKYPVFYLWHGGGGDANNWIADMRANFILDNLIAQGKMKPMIVVMPEYNVRLCTSLNNPFPDEMLHAIVPYMEQNFRAKGGETTVRWRGCPAAAVVS